MPAARRGRVGIDDADGDGLDDDGRVEVAVNGWSRLPHRPGGWC